MAIETFKDVDVEIAKLCELNNLMKDIEKIKTDTWVFTTDDVASKLKCSRLEAQKLMARQDFPSIKVGKGFKVFIPSFLIWLQETAPKVLR